MKIEIEITGITPLLMNKFNEESLDTKSRDKNETPRQAAEKTAYLTAEKSLYFPAENIFACLVCAGKYHKIGKNKVTTMKSSLIPAAITMLSTACLFDTLDFEVDSRSVVIPSTGGRIMKHRARLDTWKTVFNIEIDKTIMSENMVRQIVDDAGSKVGLGDFRPDRKGSFGKFKVTRWEKSIMLPENYVMI
jgi:hypothetical protein